MKKLILILLLFASTAWADSYPSIYSYPSAISYYNASGNWTTVKATTYQAMYDYDNPIIRCGRENSTCALSSRITLTSGKDDETSRIKVWVAPGTRMAYLAAYIEGQSGRYAFAARLGQEPSAATIAKLNSLSELEFTLLKTDGFSGSELSAKDCMGSNVAGIMTITGGGMSSGSGKWLYLAIRQRSGSMRGLSYTNQVESAPFMTWFRSNNWAAFESGPVVQPTPTPVPTPVPTVVPTPLPPTPTPAPPQECVIDIPVIPGQLYRFVPIAQ